MTPPLPRHLREAQLWQIMQRPGGFDEIVNLFMAAGGVPFGQFPVVGTQGSDMIRFILDQEYPPQPGTP